MSATSWTFCFGVISTKKVVQVIIFSKISLDICNSVKDFKSDFIPTILLVYFSRPLEEWEKLEKQDKERFVKYTNSRSVNFIVANTDMNIFEDQV
jgi:hypothetical protein